MVGRSALAVVCALAALAHADSAKLAKARAAIDAVVALDEVGNHLLEVEVPPAEAPPTEHPEPASPPPAPPPAAPIADTHVSIARRPIAWLAPALLLGGVGVGFAVGAHDADG